MAATKSFSALFLQLIFLLFVVNSANAQLKVGFYSKTCPRAEAIVKEVIDQVMYVAPSLAGPLMRMHFHDCFVRGCDGSVLLNATKSSQQVEKDALPNLSLRGYQIIDRVKSALEKECPRVVSCADIVAIVARDVTVASKGPNWEVETGRRDGRVSIGAETLTNLIAPNVNITTLITRFQAKGLNLKDLVVLSGGHTIGTSHCSSFNSRLYNFTGKGDVDPTLDSEYVKRLKVKCRPGDQNSLVEMDPGSFKTFDNSYFTLLTKRRGLFESDAALLDNSVTKEYIKAQATGKGSSFFEDFGVSMVKMGRVDVLTGKKGEIRKVCSKIN
ncbi:peroxidase 27-like [Mercurialis annua]|uniref:peroxidase 27-like n=1 Tax=Mercurialis annua TaxID=3986 RepID=UPI00215EB174|nr:peroxidase 27-like [Mercurialis annua]